MNIIDTKVTKEQVTIALPSNISNGSGLRYNQGKTRHDLKPAFAEEQYALVLTKGAEKYAERNWEKGMPWSKIISSLERHLQAIKAGEDYDKETGLLHSAHIMCNAAFLTEYYKIFPQGDDRPLPYLQTKRVGIDIDDVLADFIGGYCKLYDIPRSKFWELDYRFAERYQQILENDEFYLNLQTILSPEDMNFEPVVYITARIPETQRATIEWLFEKHRYPYAPIIFTTDKVQACRDHKVDVFIDDKFSNFVHLNKNGILCYLFDAEHNRKINVGHKRITKQTINDVT